MFALRFYRCPQLRFESLCERLHQENFSLKIDHSETKLTIEDSPDRQGITLVLHQEDNLMICFPAQCHLGAEKCSDALMEKLHRCLVSLDAHEIAQDEAEAEGFPYSSWADAKIRTFSSILHQIASSYPANSAEKKTLKHAIYAYSFICFEQEKEFARWHEKATRPLSAEELKHMKELDRKLTKE